MSENMSLLYDSNEGVIKEIGNEEYVNAKLGIKLARDFGGMETKDLVKVHLNGLVVANICTEEEVEEFMRKVQKSPFILGKLDCALNELRNVLKMTSENWGE